MGVTAGDGGRRRATAKSGFADRPRTDLRSATPRRQMGGGGDAADGLVADEARKPMEQGEAKFSFEIPLEQKVAWWHDKYRPRKPKYFNRVHTG